MQKSAKLTAALLGGTVVAGAGWAFTATSTIDDPAVNVGSVSQSVSGATVTNVVHTYTESTDTTTAISAKVEQMLSTTAGVAKVSINTGTAENCTVTVTDVAPIGTDDGVSDFSTLACDITDTANVTSVRFVING